MPTPAIIARLEQQLSITIAPSDAPDLHAFMRYGRKEEDKSQYWLKDGTLTGLKLRTLGLQDASFLGAPELSGLQGLYLAENDFSSLHLPESLQQLKLLNLADNKALQTLEFAGAMPQLEEIDLSDSGIQALHLPDCPALQKLDVSRSKLEVFSFASACSKLWWLDLSGNEGLKEVNIPNGCDALKFLHLSNCNMEQLQIGGALPNLQVLDLKGNQLSYLPADVVLDSPLETLYARGSYPKNIPDVFLRSENCLEEASIWFKQLRLDGGGQKNKLVKLMITGNGNVGKTTMVCALENGDQEEDEYACTCEGDEPHKSTQGVKTGDWKYRGIDFNYWDFGGQEVYHGTHRLFLRSQSVIVIMFDPETEKKAKNNEWVKDRTKGYLKTMNHEVSYWYYSIKENNPRSQFIIAENKKARFPQKNSVINAFSDDQGADFIHLDTRSGERMSMLVTSIRDAAKRLTAYNMPFPNSWVEVRSDILKNLANESGQKVIDKEEFLDIWCKNVPEDNKALLLNYLHDIGLVYYHEALEGKVILDLDWALEAIYKPLDREQDYFDEFVEDKGRIRVRRIFEIFGPQYSDQERWLFLGFMERCGLCFKRSEKEEYRSQKSKSDVYIFPEFLPVDQPEAIKKEFENLDQVTHLRLPLPFNDYPRIQSFIASIGRKTNLDNIWRSGIKVLTPEGRRFRVLLNYDDRAIDLSIETPAMEHWLEPIFEALGEQDNWLVKEGSSYQEFDFGAWKQNRKNPSEGDVHREKEGGEKLDERLNEYPQDADQIMLILAAIPTDKPPISYGAEHSWIRRTLKQYESHQKIEEEVFTQVTLKGFNQSISNFQPHILHFIGHGESAELFTGEGGGLCLLGRDGKASLISAVELESLFRKIKYLHPQLKLVYLNACFTEAQAAAISKAGTEESELYVIGTTDKINSALAQEVAELFYGAFAKGSPVKRCAEEASQMFTIEEEVKIRLFRNGAEIKLYQDGKR